MLNDERQCGQVFVKGDKYIGRFRADTPDGQTRRAVVLGLRSEISKPEAKRRLLELLATGGVNEPMYRERALGNSTTFNAVANQWEATRLPKQGQASQYILPKLIAKHLRPFFGKLAVETIKTGIINEWISTVMKGFEPKTVHNMYKQFRAIVNWHYQQHDQQPKRWSPDLPALKDVDPRWFTPEEARRIVEAASGQFKTLFHLANSTGCRAGELFGLRVEDFDFGRGVVRIVRSMWKDRVVPTKTRKGYREIFVDSETMTAVKGHLAGRTSGLVFTTRNGTPLRDREVILDVLYPLCDKLGIERGGMHAFRHGRVSLMRANGAPEDLVKRQIGHSSLRTTSGYTHFSEQYQRDLAESLAAKLPTWTQTRKLDSEKIDISSMGPSN